MAQCSKCNESVTRMFMKYGMCSDCYDETMAEAEQRADEAREAAERDQKQLAELADAIVLTTEASHNLPVTERLGIVTAECVIGMHLLRDVAALFRDAFGGRSQTMQKGLRDARDMALNELKLEAASLGADAVVAIDLDYSEISGAGKSMLFLVASGTAVRLRR